MGKTPNVVRFTDSELILIQVSLNMVQKTSRGAGEEVKRYPQDIQDTFNELNKGLDKELDALSLKVKSALKTAGIGD